MFRVKPFKNLCYPGGIYLKQGCWYKAVSFASGAIIETSGNKKVFMRNLRDYFEIIV